jgi:hypothetical protein
MTDIDWAPGISITIDPDAILDYTMDFTEWLNGDTIVTATVSGVACDATEREVTPTGVVFRVSDVGTRGFVKISVATASGQADDFTVTMIGRHK